MRKHSRCIRVTVLLFAFYLLLATNAYCGFWSNEISAFKLGEGKYYYQHGDYKSAYDKFKPLADQGVAEAEYDIGLMYDNGQGVDKDSAKAAQLYRQAADQGYADAQNNLGSDYFTGDGVRKDYGEAIKWFRKAADQGLTNAQYSLGAMYANGYGVPKDPIEAANWCKKAAEQGYAAAQCDLGNDYANGIGVKQDYGEAIKWIQKAIAQGNANAQYNLGVMYDNGQGVPKDPAEAVKWYKKAADQGFALAEFNLGIAYANAQGVPKDSAEAVKWYRKAAEQENVSAEFNLALAYDNGDGVPKDQTEAVKWYNKAAEQGFPDAQSNLGAMYYNGTGAQQDYGEALKWYRKAAVQGNAIAQYSLGVMYDKGQGVSKDSSEAAKWYRKAANLGYADAQTALTALLARKDHDRSQTTIPSRSASSEQNSDHDTQSDFSMVFINLVVFLLACGFVWVCYNFLKGKYKKSLKSARAEVGIEKSQQHQASINTPSTIELTSSENDTTFENAITESDSASSKNSEIENIESNGGIMTDDKEKTTTGPEKAQKAKHIAKEEMRFYKRFGKRAINFIKSQPASTFWSNLSTKLAIKLIGPDGSSDETDTPTIWNSRKKATFFLILSFLSFASVFDLVIDYFPITGNIVSSANEYLDSTTKHALETFGILRALNSGISVIKDSKLDIEPAGIGITAAIGEALQPAEDIVEQASTVMLFSAASLGIQKLLIKVGGWIGAKIFLGIAFILLFIGVCIFRDVRITTFGVNLILISLMIKLVVPLADFAVKVVSDEFLQEEYNHAFQQIHKANVDENVIETDTDQNTSSGLWGTITGAVHSAGAELNFKNRLATLKTWAVGAVEYVVSLIIIFIVQTVVFPLLFLFFLIRFMKSIFQPRQALDLVPKTV